MNTVDAQTTVQESTATEETRSSVFYAGASTGSSLLDSFVSRIADESVTTLLCDRPVVAESLPSSEESVEETSTVGEAPQEKMNPKQKSHSKTSRELAVERMGRVLGSDRAELRQKR